MRKVLITGADGFIGRNLVLELLKRGMDVYAIVYPGHDVYSEIVDSKLHIYNIDLSKILDHISDFPTDIEIMYHFAWNGVKAELRNEFDVQIKNIEITLNSLKFAAFIGIKKIVFPGSTNEYLYDGRPLGNDAIPSPDNTYGAVKVALRYLCSDFAEKKHIEFIYAIIAGIYAPDRKDNNVIYYTIDKLLHKEKPLLTKLEQLWDYVYIDDVIGALIAIGDKGKSGVVYAIGHGDNWPLSNYIKMIHQKIDPSLPLGIGEVPYIGDRLPSSCIDLTALRRDTGFVPKVAFDTGIAVVIDKIRMDMEKNRDVR